MSGPATTGRPFTSAGRCREGRPTTAGVFLNGEYVDPDFDRRLATVCDLILAADGGAARLARLGLLPQEVVGDMDSLDPAIAEEMAAAGVPLVRHAVRKDETDGELAVRRALDLGARRILLAGALGPQLDHVLGHVAVLRWLALRGVEACALTPDVWMTVTGAPAELEIGDAQGCRFSLVALTSHARVTLRGLDYELREQPVRAETCLGLGNTIVATTAHVGVHSGQALLMVLADGLTVNVTRAGVSGLGCDSAQ